MDNAPAEAPSPAPAEPSVETPTSNEPAHTQNPTPQPIDLGLTPEQAEKFKKFISNSGGFDNAFSKLKSEISTPKSAQPTPEAQPTAEPTSQPQAESQPAQRPAYQRPQGSITPEEFLAQQYFQGLSNDPKYAPIAEQISSGEVLKEMASFNIRALNDDGSINDGMVRKFLDLKAQTVPAKPTESEPNASSAPTVDYVTVGDKIDNLDQAYQIIMQPGHPRMSDAEEFIKNSLNKK